MNVRKKRQWMLRATVAVSAIALVLTGCSTTEPGTPQAGAEMPPAAEPTAPTPVTDTAGDRPDLPEDASSGALIAAALDAGDIDEPTAALYQIWSQFGDRALPDVYQGAPTPHDVSTITDILDELDAMPAEIAAQITPFFTRPADPTSAFSADGNGLRHTPMAAAADDDAAQQCSQPWISEEVPGAPFRVWACPDGDAAAAQDAIETTSDIVAAYAPAMIDLMGPPIPDETDVTPGVADDDNIDIYILPAGWMSPYRDGSPYLDGVTLGAGIAALTVPTAPRTGGTSSAYIVLGDYALETPEVLAGNLVHEIFHVLQFAHHQAHGPHTSWFYESSAVWAQNHFIDDPLTPLALPLQNSELSLHDADWTHSYTTWLWPLFMEQELGAESIATTWELIGELPDDAPGGRVIAAADEQFSVGDHFSEFVARVANLDLPGDPVDPRFSDIQPNFPNVTPDFIEIALQDGMTDIDAAGIPGLGYRYYAIDSAASADTVEAMVISNTLMSDQADVQVQVVAADVEGNYSRVSVGAGGADFCGIGPVYVVVSNPSVDIDDVTVGELTVERAGDWACPEFPVDGDRGASDSCDDTAAWTTSKESTDISLNVPIVNITGSTNDCYDEIVITLDSGGAAPGYVIEYIPEVLQEGSGFPLDLAGTAALSVIVDSPTHDQDFQSTLPDTIENDAMVDVTGFGAIEQVAFGGSFEGMTTLGFGIDGERPFTVQADPGQIVIQIAHSGGSDTGPAGIRSENPPAADVLGDAVCQVINVDMRANLLLDDFELGGRTDPLTAAEVDEYFAPVDAIWYQVTQDYRDRLDALRDFMDGLVGMDAADVVDELQGPVYRDTVRPVFWGIMTVC